MSDELPVEIDKSIFWIVKLKAALVSGYHRGFEHILSYGLIVQVRIHIVDNSIELFEGIEDSGLE